MDEGQISGVYFGLRSPFLTPKMKVQEVVNCQGLTDGRETKEKLGIRAMGGEVIGANKFYELPDTEIS